MNFADFWTLKILFLNVIWCIAKGDESNCPDVPEIERFTYMDTCYHFRDNTGFRVSYAAADADCRSRRGLLMTLVNNSTSTAVSELLNKHVDSHTILLGLKNIGGTWKWATGQTMTYNNFDKTQRATGSHDCVKMRLMEGVWEKIPCESTDWFSIYVCEHNQKTIEMTSGVQRTGSLPGVMLSLVIGAVAMFTHH